MPQKIEYSNVAGITQAGQLPEVLESLQRQLERIRQEQLAKNRSRLQGLGTEQQQCLERLTLAIIRRIFGDVASEWESSVARGHASQITEILSRLWRSVELTGTASQAVGAVAPRDGKFWHSPGVSHECFGQTHQQGANLPMNVMVSSNLLAADVERTVTQKCGDVQPTHF